MTFQLRRQARLDAQGIEYFEFEDDQTGAKHIHLAAEGTENAFAVSLATLPDKDDGRAHILEHMALCGSERFPERDPFFAMTRRSMAAFMNAMTYPDHTIYPFATQDKADFLNLMDIYLDAVFFPKLDRFDFLQEGWRHEIGESGQLELHGVVFNEMKGAFANPLRTVAKSIDRALFPGTTYASESGGDPLAIPSLTHEELVEFHRTHYHPSRAVFYTYGPIDPRELQAKIEAQVLARRPERLPRIEPQVAPLPAAPMSLTLGRPMGEGEGDEGAESGHGALHCWVLGELGRDDDDIMAWRLFFAALCEDNASPMVAAMEAAGFGRPADLMSIDPSQKQVVIALGMDGLKESEVSKASALIFGELERLAREGVPASRLQALVRAIETEEREGAPDHGMTPGLSKLFQMVPLEMCGGVALRAIDSEPKLARAREHAADPMFAQKLARRLLDSPARADVAIKPDPEFFARREAAEKAYLAERQAALTAADVERIKADTAQLREIQRAPSDSHTLPKVLPSQVRREPAPRSAIEFVANASGASTAWVKAQTNGMGTVALDIDASGLPERLWPWAELLADLALRLGAGERTQEQAQAWRQESSSDQSSTLDASTGSPASGSRLALRVSLAAKALATHAGEAARSLVESWETLRFDESDHLASVLRAHWDEVRQSLSRRGARFAGLELLRSFGPRERFAAEIGGPRSVAFWQKIGDLAKTPEGVSEIFDRLREAHEALREAPALMIWMGEEAPARAAFAAAAPLLARHSGFKSLDAVQTPAQHTLSAGASLALSAPTQVNECLVAWAGPRRGDADAPAARVLAAWLRNAFLHRALREEGGAYGARANADTAAGAIVMSSFRDPRVGGTFSDFEAAARFAQEAEIDEETLHEAIISVAKSLDAIHTPLSWAQASLMAAQAGVQEEERSAMRAGVLDCDAQTLRAVAGRWLSAAPAARAAFVRPSQAEEAVAVGLAVEPLQIGASQKPKAGPRP
jgi:presequence protease